MSGDRRNCAGAAAPDAADGADALLSDTPTIRMPDSLSLFITGSITLVNIRGADVSPNSITRH